MAYWLVKTEPSTWSWDDQLAAPEQTTHWDGVRNHQASNNLRQMERGDRAFFYHSGKPRRIVGIVEVVRPFYDDPSDETGKFGQVDFKAVAPLPQPVTLQQIKAEDDLQDLALIRQSRLSVTPIDEAAWTKICRMGGLTT